MNGWVVACGTTKPPAGLALDVFTFGPLSLELTNVRRDSRSNTTGREAAFRPPLLHFPNMSVVDLLDDPALAGPDNIGSIVTLDIDEKLKLI
ncbi:hypothetical protein ACF1BQ_021395 [Bradyrhizobium sp. RDT10]